MSSAVDPMSEGTGPFRNIHAPSTSIKTAPAAKPAAVFDTRHGAFLAKAGIRTRRHAIVGAVFVDGGIVMRIGSLRRGAARRAPNRGSAGFDTTASAIACVGVGTATSTDLTDGMTDGRSGVATADASANNGSSLRSTTVDSTIPR